MEVKIGVQNAARELHIDTDETAESIEKQVADALAAGGVLTLADVKGRKVVVPTEKLAYVEIGHGTIGQVGFRS
ncbi:MAG: DUF3107 domain-containing protein [Nocardioides sp.]|nr:DUF3107 domain-containing protein [Nocardioidaceae bacterium]MCB8958286.1 DUF3107 domain-containing protein [Nocardioides sp.]